MHLAATICIARGQPAPLALGWDERYHRSGSKTGRQVLLRACDVRKLEADWGEEGRPWDYLEEPVPTDLFLSGKDTEGNSHWLRPDLEAYCSRVWGCGLARMVAAGYGLVGCRVPSALKQIFRHTETPLWSSSTEQLFCG